MNYMYDFNLKAFISDHITKRQSSFFQKDIDNNEEQLRHQITGSSVLVIGGGGTIGSNYIKSILPYKPARVVVIDSNENALTELVRDVRSTFGLYVPNEFITYPVNLSDSVFEKIYTHYKPFEIVANFAAHKHVRSEKDIFSVEAMIRNNLFFAKSLFELLKNTPPHHFFCVSTDKAANPVNLMGATKKVMEDLMLGYTGLYKCTTARFANVAFSNGSLLDGFLNRLRNKQPLSVPNDIERYFVSPAEAGDICMLSSVLGNSGDIFFPKLGEHELVSFLSITEAFLHGLGLNMYECGSEQEAKEIASNGSKPGFYPVYTFTSDTTGEKLYEEFYTENDVVNWDRFDAMAVSEGRSSIKPSLTQKALSDLENLFNSGYYTKQDIVNVLKNYLPNFEHIERGLTLDSKM